MVFCVQVCIHRSNKLIQFVINDNNNNNNNDNHVSDDNNDDK